MEAHNPIQSAVTKAGSSNSVRYKVRFWTLTWIFVIVLVFLMPLTPFNSQEQSLPDVIIPIPHPMTSLLRSELIQKELELSPAQLENIDKIISQYEQPLWRLRDLPVRQRNEKAAPLILQLREKLSQALSEKQFGRFGQLVLQARGVDAILEPQVMDALNLSPVHTQRIRQILNESRHRLTSLQSQIGNVSEARRRARLARLRAQASRSVSGYLNDRQQQAFTKLYGSNFNELSNVPNIACRAPEIEVDTWLNSQPVKLSELKGKVTVVHFYAFGCGNCIRNLPHYNDWRKTFDKERFQIIGIHRPETQFERDIEKVREKAFEAVMNYPIAVDNDSKVWDSYANSIWPSIYIIDKSGFIRYWWYGELNWQGAKSELYLRNNIRELIEEPL